MSRKPRRNHYEDEPLPLDDRGFFAVLPAELDRGQRYVLIRRYAEPPGAQDAGLLGTIIGPGIRTGEARRFPSETAALTWARTSGVRQIVVEQRDGVLQLIPPLTDAVSGTDDGDADG